MIANFDQATLLVHDIDAGVAAYRALLGREPTRRLEVHGLVSIVFNLDNARFCVASPNGAGAQGDDARRQLETHGEGLARLALGVVDLELTSRRLRRLSFEPHAVAASLDEGLRPNTMVKGKPIVLPKELTYGVAIELVQYETLSPGAKTSPAAIEKMDLVVISTRDPVRAGFFYGAQLGLPLAFDRMSPAIHGRLMQFPIGDMLIEVTGRPGSDCTGEDRIWGMGWSVADADATRQRLLQTGLNVSEIRVGAKPNTRVFTIRSGTCGVPTLIVQHLSEEKLK
jgi:hypothetical protein